MLIWFPSTFVVGTKITYGYNFVVTLGCDLVQAKRTLLTVMSNGCLSLTIYTDLFTLINITKTY